MIRDLVSVIIPCYRQGRFLAAAVQSVLNQTYSPIEIIVVNDGSDDETESVAQSFGDRIRYTWQPNSGLSAARNCGISLARGDYLHFLDADDLLHPDGIRWLVEATQGRTNPLCVMGYRNFESDMDLTRGIAVLPPWSEPLECRLLHQNIGPPQLFLSSTAMVRSAGGFDATVSGCEDWDMWLRLVFAGAEVVPVYQLGAYYRQHPTSMSRNRFRMSTASAEVLRRNLHRIATNPDTVRRLGGSPASLTRAVRQTMIGDLLDAAFQLRQDNRYAAAAYYYYLCLREIRWSTHPLVCLCKLLPHKILRSLNLLPHQPGPIRGTELPTTLAGQLNSKEGL